MKISEREKCLKILLRVHSSSFNALIVFLHTCCFYTILLCVSLYTFLFFSLFRKHYHSNDKHTIIFFTYISPYMKARVNRAHRMSAFKYS